MLNGAWVLGWIHKKVAGFQRDEIYIGTAEEREAKNMADDEDNLHIGAGHMIVLPGFYESAPQSLQKLLRADKSVEAYIKSLHGAMENGEVTDVQRQTHKSNKAADLKHAMSEESA